jgi:hypothetical protein
MTVWPLSLQTQGVTVIVSTNLEVQEVLVRGNEARQTWRSIFRALVSEMKGARLSDDRHSRFSVNKSGVDGQAVLETRTATATIGSGK